MLVTSAGGDLAQPHWPSVSPWVAKWSTWNWSRSVRPSTALSLNAASINIGVSRSPSALPARTSSLLSIGASCRLSIAMVLRSTWQPLPTLIIAPSACPVIGIGTCSAKPMNGSGAFEAGKPRATSSERGLSAEDSVTRRARKLVRL